MKFLVENLNLFKQLGGADNTTVNIINVTSLSPDNHYNVNDSVSIQVVFSEAVFVTGKPQLELETGDVDRIASYDSGDGTDSLIFIYTVQNGDTSSNLEYTSSYALSLNDGAIKDNNDNDVDLTLPSPLLISDKAIVIDNLNSVITDVTSSTSNDNIIKDDTIDIQFVFSKAVYITESPKLALQSGATFIYVLYS